MVAMNNRQLTGQTEEHLITENDLRLHPEAAQAFLQLQQRAAEQGMDLQIASGFRSFERQLVIWNAKASGQRPVLDDDGAEVDMMELTPLQQVQAIMRWSALPGASRHHWGTDMDVWDRAAVPADYQLQLTPEEYSDDGPFARLSQWLEQQRNSGFFRPYAADRGGIAPEPWHLSYRPVADQFVERLTPQTLAAVLEDTDIALKQTVLDNMDQLFDRFIQLSTNSHA
ncbi:M15 family metallopeptidase [Porticoccus sp. W117]|uniref:M15 family metallopeptidase n=1 Tax=Porticoccus sp. W117 TaxID=3054777 RepID=UPI0025947546|nr:M15 family metallopeptidase [Porticoccus sp. W117]MDM3871769.1 M15 family metallopeptidase [Porticoccus sp. W117]